MNGYAQKQSKVGVARYFIQFCQIDQSLQLSLLDKLRNFSHVFDINIDISRRGEEMEMKGYLIDELGHFFMDVLHQKGKGLNHQKVIVEIGMKQILLFVVFVF